MDAYSFPGIAAPSAFLEGRRKTSRPKGSSTPWYISFLERHVTVMRIVRDRREAIAIACAMLDRGIEVTGVGPMLDTGQQEIDADTLREICRQRRTV
jgi:hypothetical protein